jgi:hypothetical protein
LGGLRDRFETHERDDRERDAEQQMVGRRPEHVHRVHQQIRVERKQEAEEQDRGLADDVERAYDPIERRRLAHADYVERAQSGNEQEYGREVHPRMHLQHQDRDELTEIVDARPSEERDVDGKVEQNGPSGDKPENIAQPAHDEILSAAGDGIRRGQLRVGEADADVDDAGEEERNVGRPARRTEDEPEADEDVGADVRITP